MSTFPEDLRYSSEHEWVRGGNSTTVRVGITDFASEALGDIVYASMPTVGEDVVAGDACGELESTKSVSEIFSPVSGVVVAVNEALADTPEMINTDAYGDGWLFEVEVTNAEELDGLMDADGYAKMVEDE